MPPLLPVLGLILAATSASATPPTTTPPTSTPDPLWLRYDTPVPNPATYAKIASISVKADARVCKDPAARPALQAVADELSTALTGLLGRAVPSTCCGCGGGDTDGDTDGDTTTTLLVSVGDATTDAATVDLGPEGFTIAGPHGITAATASGALYGAFKYLSFVQQHRPLPLPASPFTSQPAMKIRAWNLWDKPSGGVERGNAGNSLLWPYALYDEERPPPRNLLYVATACNASDPHQQVSETEEREG